MKKLGILLTGALLLTVSHAAAPQRPGTCVDAPTGTAASLQALIDHASLNGDPVVNLGPGVYHLSADQPIVLKHGVSLQASDSGSPPTIFVGPQGNSTATLSVPADNKGWSIKGIVFDNVNIVVSENNNGYESSVQGNLFINGGRGSVISSFGRNLYIEGNIFLRDYAHRGLALIPNVNTTNAGVVFTSQKASVIANNIFGMDLREARKVEPYVAPELQHVLRGLEYYQRCHSRVFDHEQGYLASGVQLYSTVDITIKGNILNGTFPDRFLYGQDHGISVVGSNETYVYQNFFAGWELADFGGGIRFTSAVDGYVISNYFANTAAMMYAAVHADFMQVHNMVVYNNMFYKFLGKQWEPKDPALNGWLYEGITFFDFYTARLNYTIAPPIWNSSVPLSPWGWHIVISDNKFAAAKGLDPNVISLGNLDPSSAYVDRRNCYTTTPLVSDAESGSTVALLWRQTYDPGLTTQFGGKVPKSFNLYSDKNLLDNVPANLRYLPIPDYWKAFTLANNTQPMLRPDLPCYHSSPRLSSETYLRPQTD
ncbi:hypothetical protein BX666DRAFT_2032345 [Dichotomocladium elegans]|nr:hypothetical protein BX666DRAFT_2032345 [Dichotomocladium elegans]